MCNKAVDDFLPALKLWHGKTRVTSHELWVTSH